MTATFSTPQTGALDHIEERLDRIERALRPVEELAQQAPLLLATVTEIADSMAARMGDLDERSHALIQVTEKLTRPQTLETLEKAVEMAEQAPALVATGVDVMDASMRQLAESGLPIEHLVEIAQSFIKGLAELSTSPEVRNLLQSGMLNPQAVKTLGQAAEALADASKAPQRQVGVFGALRALGQPEVQRAIGFLMNVAERFGQSIDQPPALPSKN
jgi:uncharacterized protein YjgD (DUF1641 family)